MFDITPIPAFKDNYIWLLTRGTEAFVVDPGDAEPVLAVLDAQRLHLAGILISHHHADHQGGVAALVERFQPRVLAPENESITGCNEPLRGGEVVDVLGVSVSVIAVPGHTRGHLAYAAPGVLFCGDTLFGAGCGRLFEGTPEQMSASLDRLSSLPEATLVYCAHEYTAMNLPFALAVDPDNRELQARVGQVSEMRAQGQATVPLNLGQEKATNPFLRCDQPAIIAATMQREPALAAAVNPEKSQIFAALRAWRNVF